MNLRLIRNFFNTQLKKNLSLLFILFLLVSCNKNQIYRETHREFPANRWMKIDTQKFEARIINIGETYNIFLNFGHVYGFQFEEVPMSVEMISPSGKIEYLEFMLKILDENENDIGDCTGDICDLQHILKTDYSFKEQGIYTFNVNNRFDNMYLPNVLAVGIEINKTE